MKAINTTITILVVLVIGAGAFLGGTFFQKHQDSLRGLTGAALMEKIAELGSGQATSGVLGDETRGGPEGFAGRGMMGDDGMINGRGTIGKITAKTDSTLTVELLNGSTRTINISNSTQIRKTTTGSLADLSVGETVSALGANKSDGSLDASSVQLRDATDIPQGVQ